MTEQEKLIILATLEAYVRKCRATHSNKGLDDAEHGARICSAIVAKAFGYDNRMQWNEAAESVNLLDSSLFTIEDLKEQYKVLNDKVNEIGKSNSGNIK